MGTNPSTTSTTLNLSKVYGSLCAGTIPVYLGAPNVAEHVPPNSVIPVPNNFNEADVAKVAAAIQKVFDSKDEYLRLTQWKKDGVGGHFNAKMEYTKTHSYCRLCRYVYHNRIKKNPWSHEFQQCGRTEYTKVLEDQISKST